MLLSLFSTSLLRAQEYYSQDYYAPSPVPDRIMLTLTSKPDSSVALNWRTNMGVTRGYVQVTPASASPDLLDSVQVYPAETTPLLTDRNGANYHSALVDRLLPETQYAYRVGDSTHWSEWIHFETASSAAKPHAFIYFGDAQNDVKSMWSRNIRNAYSKMPDADFLLHAGDLINRADRDHEWGEWFYAGGWIYSQMPSVTIPGNHEYNRNAEGERVLSGHWRPSFTLPENGPEGLEETVYYLDYQDTRIIALNSTAFQAFERDSARQVDWVTEVLQNNPNTWTVVTMHHPIYSSKFGRSNDGLRDALQPLFEKYRVDLVLQGHDHTYGRGSNLPLGNGKKTIGGPIYVVSVSGPKMYDLGLEEWMQRGASNTQLYQIIRIDGGVLRFEAYTVTDELYDAFELHRQRNGRNLFIDQAPRAVEERLEVPPRFQQYYTEDDWAKYRQRFEAYKARQQDNK